MIAAFFFVFLQTFTGGIWRSKRTWSQPGIWWKTNRKRSITCVWSLHKHVPRSRQWNNKDWRSNSCYHVCTETGYYESNTMEIWHLIWFAINLEKFECTSATFFIHAPAFESLTVSGCFAQKWIRQRAVRPDLIRFARCASFALLCLFSFSSPRLFPEKVGVENPWKRSPRCKVFYVIGWMIV